ncbi:MAG: ABC transporter substrate-binding protein [Acetobacteraceae bacterium]
MKRTCLAAAALAAALFTAPAHAEQKPLRAVMNIELQVLDPIVTTATVTRAFGYMVYDTLVSMDSKGAFHPQMLEGWKVSDDRMTWTFTLRPGLTWHDGAPVTAEDCVASLKRWGKKDGFGKLLMTSTKDIRVIDAHSFQIELAKPFAFVIEAIGKPNSQVPFMMPARMAATPPNKDNVETIGSGPFTFRRDEWRPGDRAIFRRNPAYQPRKEPADGLAGGKVAGFDVVEFVSMPDPATRVAAIQTGAVDYLEILPFDYIDLMRRDPKVKVVTQTPMAHIMGGLSVNNLLPPFNDVRIRKALQIALDQKEIMGGLGLPPDMYLPFCQSIFLCGGPYQSYAGTEALRNPSAETAKKLLAEAGY